MDVFPLLSILVDFIRPKGPQGVVVIFLTSLQGIYTNEVANLLQIIFSKISLSGVMIIR